MNKEQQQIRLNTILLAFFSTTVLLIFSFLFLKTFYHPALQSVEQIRKMAIPEIAKYFIPKPQERFIWEAFLILLPIYSYLSAKAVTLNSCLLRIQKHQDILSIAAISLIIGLVFTAFFHSDFIRLTSARVIPLHHGLRSVSQIILVTTISLMASYQIIFKNDARFYKMYIWPIIIIAVLLQLLSLRLYNLYSVSIIGNPGMWTPNLDTVFYPLSQVVMGKTLLVNLPSQYGLYAEILNPLFKIIGLTPFTFTLVMGIIEGAALLLLANFLFKTIKNPYFIVIYLLSICLLTGYTWLYINLKISEPYFQYWPIRFIFPVLGIYLFLRIAKNISYQNILAMSVIGAIALIWNLDSGIPVLGAFWAYLSMRLFFRGSLSRLLRIRHLAFSCVTVITCLLIFGLYLHIKSGQPLQLIELVKYQRIFAIMGMGMIPMSTTLHPWMIFYAIYVLGIVTAMVSWMKNVNSKIIDVIFYLSILGFGLFTYYQSRSHEWNLVDMTWLPLLIAIILSDRLLRLIKVNALPSKWRWLAFSVAFIGSMFALNYILGVSTLLKYAKSNWSIMLNHKKTALSMNIKFIQENTQNITSVVILASNQGIYYAETGLASAIDGPSITETLLQSDHDAMLTQLLSQPIQKLFIEEDNTKFPASYYPLLSKYHIKSVSHWGMIYLTHKDNN